MPGRNDLCPCGSGKKYKKCCAELRSAALRHTASPPPEPLSAMRRALERSPNDPRMHFHYGNALHDLGDVAGAIESQRRALALKADFAEAHDSLGAALQDAGRPSEAAASFIRAIELRPGFAEAHGNLGNALMDLGRFEEAVHHYHRMLEQRSDLAEVHNNLGNALLALRRFEEAASSYRLALAIRPNAAGAHANLGNALRELGRPQEALTHCRRALELEPDSAEAARLVGNAQFDLGLLDEAAGSYELALTLTPDFAEALIALCKVQRQIGRVSEAELSCRKALAVAGDSPEVLTMEAELRADRGFFAEAEQLFRRAIAIAPELPEAWAGLARYRKMDVDTSWLAAAQSILRKPMSIGREINLRYALGKYFDDVREYENAFASYRLANELKKRSGIKHDRVRLERRVDNIVALYNRDWLRRVQGQGSQSDRPVFIVGMPRSGTTLIEQIIASHPEGFGCGELRFWHQATANYEASAPSGLDGTEIPAAAKRYLDLLLNLSAGASRTIDKMPANFMNLGLIHAAFPNARIIHMQRNPLDIGLSIYFQIFSNTHSYANDLQDIAHYVVQYSRLMQHWRATLPANAVLNVPYESLVENPEPWIRKIVQFVGLPWDPRCLDFHRTERTIITASNWQVRQRISSSSSGRWRNYEQFLGPLRPLAELETSA